MSTLGPATTTNAGNEGPNWRPLDRIQRRVAGVLVEKAKTTPENYPLSLNGITTGCNQKSNRSPQMELDPSDVELALEELREMGAVVEIQGDGRVPKYKHCLYDWLGVDKVEMAVMAELMLRGEQTVGELRGRAARMEPIADLNALRPVLNSLIAKKLVISLTSEGRGQVVTHGLYQPNEMEKATARAGEIAASIPSPSRPAAVPKVSEDAAAALREEIAELRQEVEQLRERVNVLES
jgi:uncharacterized protein YceH (UPF0502 family)